MTHQDTPPRAPHARTPRLPQTAIAGAAPCLQQIAPPLAGAVNADDILAGLHAAHCTDAACEDLLFVQAHLLDALFKRLVFRDMHSRSTKFEDGTPYLREDHVELALKSQRLARNAIEALSLVRARKGKTK